METQEANRLENKQHPQQKCRRLDRRIAAAQKVQVGELEIDRKSYGITDRGRERPQPRKEFELLYKLAG